MNEYVSDIRKQVQELVRSEYGIEPDYPFESTPDAAVFRRQDNRKWFGLMMTVRRDRLGLPGDSAVDILNLKCDPKLVGTLRNSEGFLPAYHMNKKSWITVLLDGSVPLDQINWLLGMSFDLVRSKSKGKKNE